MKKKLLLSTLILTLIIVLFFHVSQTFAQTPTGQYYQIIQKLAQKFGLKESDVQSVFDEVKNERRTQMQVKFEQMLSDAVNAGKITEAQKQAILAKKKELMAKQAENRDKLKNMIPEERRQLMSKQKTELDSWAKENNIDLSYFFGGFKHPKAGMREG